MCARKRFLVDGVVHECGLQHRRASHHEEDGEGFDVVAADLGAASQRFGGKGGAFDGRGAHEFGAADLG